MQRQINKFYMALKHLEVTQDFLLRNSSLAGFFPDYRPFDIVIDANMIITDLLHRAKNGNIECNNEKLVKAGVLNLHIPEGAVLEIESSTIPQFAKSNTALKFNVTEVDLLTAFDSYLDSIYIHEQYDRTRAFKFDDLTDNDDAMYIALAVDINALGVLTCDKDYAFLKSRKLDNATLKAVQEYVCIIADLCNIKLTSLQVLGITLHTIGDVINLIMIMWNKMPPVMKLCMTIGIIFLITRKPVKPALNQWATNALSIANKASEIDKQMSSAAINKRDSIIDASISTPYPDYEVIA